MIKIVPDKEGKLTQWDLNRKVIVTGYEGVAEVHFASPGDDHGAYPVKLVNGQAEIPNILLTMAGTINVYLYPDDRTVFATTLWAMAREKPDDYVYTETEVLSYKTLDEKIGDLAELTTTARENLVAAINEAATKGMASIYMRVAEGYIEYSGDGVSWKQLIAVAELKGEKGDPGSDATVDIVTPTAESTDKQAASAKAVWDMLGGGGSGTDISLGVTGASVGDIIKVKQVDASGKPTAWEAAQMLSGSGKAKSQILINQEITELTASLSVTLEHDFHNLTAIINCGTDGAALTAGSDGTAAASKIGLLIDTTSWGFNPRKVAYTDTSTATWRTSMIGAEWSDDLSVFKRGFAVELATAKNQQYYFPFGGSTAMYGTLETGDNAPRTGKTANIVVNGAYLNVGTRVVLWGEYYE